MPFVQPNTNGNGAKAGVYVKMDMIIGGDPEFTVRDALNQLKSETKIDRDTVTFGYALYVATHPNETNETDETDETDNE